MATAKDRAQAKAGSGLNDDIGEQKRLELYRTQVVLREAEQRAYDLFLQNLVKGTSHLSLGQEAVAAGFAGAMKPGDLSFCTYRGHAHTLARGVPIEKVLGELMQRDNGLMASFAGTLSAQSSPSPVKLDPFFEVRTPQRSYGPARLTGGTTVTPLARRLAVEAGIDLSRLTGSGPRGRISARDVQSAHD